MLKIKEWYLSKFKKQHSFIYCTCGNELISSNSKISPGKNIGTYIYKCKKCGKLSEWDLTTPVPIKID